MPDERKNSSRSFTSDVRRLRTVVSEFQTSTRHMWSLPHALWLTNWRPISSRYDGILFSVKLGRWVRERQGWHSLEYSVGQLVRRRKRRKRAAVRRGFCLLSSLAGCPSLVNHSPFSPSCRCACIMRRGESRRACTAKAFRPPAKALHVHALLTRRNFELGLLFSRNACVC